MNILLVDDEAPALRELVDTVAAVLPGEQVFSFLKAGEAMKCAETTHIDLAFLDINMRFINGITMAKKLQELYPKCNIIFCTGYTEYALDALEIYCSGYLLKPITQQRMHESLMHLRNPLPLKKHRIELRCFGNFDVFCDEKPVAFKYKKTRELLAYLTDRNGAEVTTQEIMAAIFEESKPSYFSNIRLDLLNTFDAFGVSDAIITAYGRMSIARDRVSCDYFDYLDGKNRNFQGEYMSQYSFAEVTCSMLEAHYK